MQNEVEPFQGPEYLPYELLGYWEEFHDMQRNKYLGYRMVEKADRLLGVQGALDLVLTSPIVLMKGAGKSYLLKASPKRPLKVRATLQILCGRLKDS